MMSTSPRRTGPRLATSSAIALSAALALAPAGPARAQSLPVVSNDGGATLSTAGNTLNVNINDANRVIEWTTFDVDPGRQVNFNSANGATPFSVLNRVVTNAQSDINGAINSQNNIAVWLVNQTGILFGPSGRFSGGRLVLSTHDLNASFTDADFLAGTGTTRFSGNSIGAITLQAGGGDIETNGSFIAIGQDITVAKTVTATGGDVALIAARDVSFPVGLGSPLSITINEGTTLATAKVDSSGAITGNNVRLVGASQAGAIASLLNVSGGSLTASAVDGAVVLATGTVAARNVTVSSAAAVDGVTVAGALNPGANRDLTITATGNVTTGGTLTARDIAITGQTVPTTGLVASRDLALSKPSATALTFDPNTLGVSWGRDISLTSGGDVDVTSVIPLPLTPLPFSSPGAIRITSNTGNIIGGPLGVLSATGNVELQAAGNIQYNSVSGANVSVTANTLTIPGVLGGNPIQASGNLLIDLRSGVLTFDPTNAVGGRAWGTSGNGNLTLIGAAGVTVTEDISTAANAANPSATTGSVAITATTGDIRADSITTTDGAITLTASNGLIDGNGAATMTINAQGASGDVAILANGLIDLANVTASNSIGVRSASGVINGATFDAGEDIAIDGGAAVTVTTLTADDDIDVRAAGLVTLGTVLTDGSGPDNRTVNVAGAPIAFTPSAANGANISLASTGSGLALTGSATTSGAAGRDITLGAFTAIDARTLNSARNIVLNAPVSTAGAVNYTAIGDIAGNSIASTAGGISLTAGGNVRGGTNPTMALSASGAGSDIRIVAGGQAALANVSAGDSIAIRTTGSASGTVLDAGEDIAIQSGSTASFTALNADDDIDVNSTGAITVGTALARGAGPDTRRVNLSTPAISFDAPEPADHVGSSIRLTSSGGAVNVTTSATTQGIDGRDILLGGTTIDAGTLTAARNIAITGPVSTAGAINYVATGSIGASSITSTAGGMTLTAGTSATFSSLTTSNAVSGDIAVVAGTTAALGNVSAGRSLGVRAGGNISGGTISAGEDIAVQGAGVGNTVGLTSLTAGDDIDVNSSGAVTIGSATTTGNGLNSRSVNVGAAPISFPLAFFPLGSNIRVGSTGAGVSLTSGTTGAVRAGDIVLQGNTTVQAGTLTSALGAVSLFSTTGNTTITNSVTAQNAVTVNSGSDVLIADYVAAGPESGFIRSAGGAVNITAARTVGRFSGPTTMTTATGIDALAAGGTITITGGDVRLDSITAAGDVTIDITGSLTGTAPAGGDRGPGLSGGGIFSSGATTIDAGNGAGDLVRLNRIEAGGAVSVDATNIAIGTLHTPGVLTLTNPGGAFYIGVRSSPGNLAQAFPATIANVNPSSVTATDDIEAGFGKVNITSTGGSITANVGNIDNAELGAITAANNIAIVAQGLTATGAIQAGGSLALTAIQGTLQIAGATAGTTANLTKIGGALANPGDELRVTGTLTASGNATISSGTHARLSDVVSTGGNIAVTATLGDITGLARVAAATDGRLLTGFDRANLTASAANRTITTSALGLTAGATQLGTVLAGNGAGGLAADQITVSARAVDIAAATALNGNLRASANTGELRLATGNAGGNASLSALAGARIGDLTTAGDIAVSTFGDISGLALAAAATDGRLLTGFGRANLTASGANRTVGVSSFLNVQLGSVVAGAGGGVLAGDQISVGARAIDVSSATAANGDLRVIASAGDVRLGTGLANGGATVTGATNARIGSIVASNGSIVARASNGQLTGLVLATPATDGRTVTGFGRTDLTANAPNQTITAEALGGAAQFGTLSAGSGATTMGLAQITASGAALDLISATAANGALLLSSASGDAIVGTGVGRTGASLSSGGNARLGSLTSQSTTTVTAAGDITGLAVVPGAPTPPSSLTVPLNPAFGLANIAGEGAGNVFVSSFSGIGQFGTLSGGTGIDVTARAVSVQTATSGGDLRLTASEGSLVLGTGSSGGLSALTKSGFAGEIDVTSLTTGTLDGSTGLAFLNSVTDVRVDTITARGGDITIFTSNGQVTGRNGGRATLTAALARDAGGVPIPGSDRSISVTAATIARLGAIAAGDNVTVTAGGANNGAIDATTITTARGDITLRAVNNGATPPTINGLVAATIAAGGSALLETSGTNGGSIDVDTVTAGVNISLNTVPTNASGSILVDFATATAGGIAARSDNFITGTTYAAGTDITVSAGHALALGSATAGDDIDLSGAGVTLGTARAIGNGPNNSSIDLALPGFFQAGELASKPNANLAITATGGGTINVTGDLSAQRNLSVVSPGAATLLGNVTAGAPVVPAGPVIAGDLTVTSGGTLTLGAAAPRTVKATGAVTLTAAGNVGQGAGLLTIQSNSDQVGTEALAITANGAGGIALGSTTFIGGSVANHESIVDLRALGGAVTVGSVDAQGLTIRAGGQVTANGAIAAGNAARPADPVAGFRTIDIATTAGGIGLTSAIATGAGHDILLSAPGAVTAATLVAARDIGVTGGSVNIGTATATSGALSIVAGAGASTLGVGTAGTSATVRGTTASVTNLTTGGALLVEATAGNATLATGTAGGAGTVRATGTAGVSSLVSGGAATLAAGTAATAGTIRSTGADVDVSGATVTIGTANAATALNAAATGGDLLLTEGVAGGAAFVRSTGLTTVTTLTAGTDATIRGATVGATTATATGGALLVEATAGNATLGTGVAGGSGTVRGTSAAAATSLTTAGALLVEATAGSATLATGVAGTAGTVRGTTAASASSLTTGGALLVEATAGNASLVTGIAGGAGTVRTTGTASLTSLTAAGTATLAAGTTGTVGAIRSTGADVVASGATLDIGTAQAGTSLTTTASGGNLALGTGTAGTTAALSTTGGAGDVSVATSLTTGGAATIGSVRHARLASVTAATGDVSVTAIGEVTGVNPATATQLTATTGAVNVTSGQLARLGTIAGNGVTVAAGTIIANDVNAGTGALSLIANNGSASLTTGRAGTTALVRSSGTATVGALTAGTDATIQGASVDATTATATGGALLVEATAGTATLGTGVAGTTGTVRGTTAASVTNLTTGGALLVEATGGNASLGTGTAGGAGTVRATGTAGLTSLTAAGAATLAAGTAGTAGTIRSTGANVVAAAATLDIGTAQAGTSLTATASGGNLTLGTGTADTTALVRSSGTTTVGALTAGTDATIQGASVGATTARATGGALLVEAAAGAVTLGTGSAGGAGTVRGTTAASATNLATGGALLIEATGGNATLGTGNAGGAGTVRATGAASLTSLAAAGTATLAAGTAGTAGTIRSTGADVVATGATLDIGTAQAGTSLTATASGGNLALGTGTAGTTAALSTTGGAGDVSVATSLTTGGAATIGSVRHARLASITAATGNVAVTAAGEVTGIGAGNANLVASAGAVNVQGGTLARLGTVGAAGTTGVTVTADTIAATDVNAGTGALSLVADTGGVTLGTGRSGTTAVIDARQTATISAGLTAGTSALIRAADAQVGGQVAATRIDVINTGTNNALVLGSASGTGFVLDQTEVNRLNAPEVVLDARSNDVAIGALAFDADTGGNRVDVMGLGRIDITGAVSAPGGSANRTIRFGGSATASDKASVIRVAATASGGGGRLLMPNAALELRGVKIGVGQDGRFLESLGLAPGGTPLSVAQAGTDFIANPQSTLYYAGNFGGAPYNPIGQTLVEASSLTVRTSDYALFQNTGTVGQSLGAVLDARATNPRVPALSVSGPNPPDAGGFAIFGTINGIEASAAALLGAADISVVAVDGANTRINGCIVGSGGGGCLSNSIVQPVVNVFDSSRGDVLKTSSDFEAPFDPVVGTNNESLFGDVGTLGLEDIPLTPDTDPAVEECGGPDQAPCAASEGETK